nr:hypothetical protein Iba_chr04fCG14370 [Ipomoea batatas]
MSLLFLKALPPLRVAQLNPAERSAPVSSRHSHRHRHSHAAVAAAAQPSSTFPRRRSAQPSRTLSSPHSRSGVFTSQSPASSQPRRRRCCSSAVVDVSPPSLSSTQPNAVVSTLALRCLRRHSHRHRLSHAAVAAAAQSNAVVPRHRNRHKRPKPPRPSTSHTVPTSNFQPFQTSRMTSNNINDGNEYTSEQVNVQVSSGRVIDGC